MRIGNKIITFAAIVSLLVVNIPPAVIYADENSNISNNDLSPRIITGSGYSFDEATGTLKISSTEGSTNWSENIDKELLAHLIINDGTDAIQDHSFEGCMNLEDINFGITTNLLYTSFSIGQNAFSDCIKLKNLNFPSFPYGLQILDSAFSGCESLEIVNFSDVSGGQLEEIGDKAFCGCKNLNKIISYGKYDNLKIGTKAFWNTSIASNPFQGDGITFDEYNSFGSDLAISQFCESTVLREEDGTEYIRLTIKTKEGLQQWRNYFDQEQLIELKIASGITVIPNGAFMDCINLTMVELPESLKSIGEFIYNDNGSESEDSQNGVLGSFENCSSLEAIHFPSGLTTIATHAFIGSNLGINTIIAIPETVENIGTLAFGNCPLRKGVRFEGTTAPNFYYVPFSTAIQGTDNNYTVDKAMKKEMPIYVPNGYDKDGKTPIIELYSRQIGGWYTILALPNLTSEIKVTEGNNAILQVSVWKHYKDKDMNLDFIFQWQKESNGSWTDIQDATNEIYEIPSVTVDQFGNYRCIVTATWDVYGFTYYSIPMESSPCILSLMTDQDSIQQNYWVEPLTISGWTYGEPANSPHALPAFGFAVYTYSQQENGIYSNTVPSMAGSWYVKATVAETSDYTGLESSPVAFTISSSSLPDGDDKPGNDGNKPGGDNNSPGDSNKPGGGNNRPGDTNKPDSGNNRPGTSNKPSGGNTPGNDYPSIVPPNGSDDAIMDNPSTPSQNTGINNESTGLPDGNSTSAIRLADSSQNNEVLEDKTKESSETTYDDTSSSDIDADDDISSWIKDKKNVKRINLLLIVLILILCIIRILILLIKKRKGKE